MDVSLNILAAAPVLTSVSPALVAVGSDDTTITIHGSGFTTSSTLQVEGIPWLVTPVVFVDSSTLQFSLPASYFSVPQSITVAVQNPQAALSNVLSVAVGQPAPQFTAASVVNAASYAAGGVAPGEIVTVYGSNFGAKDNTQVTFDYEPATVLYVTSTQLAVTVPYFVSGTTSMIVTSNGVGVRAGDPECRSISSGHLQLGCKRQRPSCGSQSGLQRKFGIASSIGRIGSHALRHRRRDTHNSLATAPHLASIGDGRRRAR